MTSLLTLLLACLIDSKDSLCSEKKFSYLDLTVTANWKALFYHVGDTRIGTISSADIWFLTVHLFTAINKENIPSKFVCD